MKRLRIIILAIGAAALVALLWAYRQNAATPEVPFGRAASGRLVSTLSTNGKVEPYQWWPVRAARPGAIAKIAVERGDRVARGAVIATLDSGDARSRVSAAEAAVSQAKAELATVRQGGAASARVEIENAVTRARQDLANARTEMEALERLEKRSAATRQQVTEARQRVEKIEAEMQALERKRGAVVDQPDLDAAQARLSQARAELEQAQLTLSAGRIVAPVTGVIYELPVRPGAYVNTGELVASIGNLERLRVRVYVDEPELGRVREGMPVTITWDALPGRRWQGSVESMPTQVIALGTRQVGEVVVTIENSELALLPGTNVNAEIQTEVVESAITVPRDAIRRDQANKPGVFALRGNQLQWVPVRLGPSSVTQTAVQGLAAGELVALFTDQPLTDGQRVQPVVR